MEPPSGEGEPTCVIFDEYASRVPATCDSESSEEDPAGEESDDEPECGDHSDQSSCHADGCKWTKGPPDGLEHCYDP